MFFDKTTKWHMWMTKEAGRSGKFMKGAGPLSGEKVLKVQQLAIGLLIHHRFRAALVCVLVERNLIVNKYKTNNLHS